MGEVYQYHRFSLEPAWGNLARSTGYRAIGIGSRHHRPFICYAACRRTYSADRQASSKCRSRSEEHTSELQSLMRISYAVFCLKKKTKKTITQYQKHTTYNSHQYT